MNRSVVGKLVIALCFMVAVLIAVWPTAQAAGTKPVTSGWVIRGLTIPPPGGAAGTSTGRTCNFSDEDVSQTGHLEDASVNCRQGNTNLNGVLAGLPDRFNAYCAIQASRLPGGARLIAAPVPGNDNHCSLSALKPKDAQGLFGGAVWR